MQSHGSATAFYTLADANHFIGLVGLINSLRLQQHEEPVYVADCGLTPTQRERLRERATLVPVSGDGPPNLLKTVVPLAHPAEVMILIDADIIVTRRLDDLVDESRDGRIVAFADRVSLRFDDRWSELLALGSLRRQTYVNSGLVALGRSVGVPVLEQISAGCRRVDAHLGYGGGGGPDYPFYYLDQDVLNAVLATRAPDELNILSHDLAPFPPFQGLKVTDAARLRCRYADGREPFLLHHVLTKPWLAATRSNAYSQLLSRLLLEPDLAVRLDPGDVPLRLRPGAARRVDRRRSDAVAGLRSMRGKLGVRRMLHRRAAATRQTAAAAQPTTDARLETTAQTSSSPDPGA